MILITYIISDIDKAIAFEWIAEYINKEKCKLSFILLNPGSSALENYLVESGFEVNRIKCVSKRNWPLAILQTRKLLRQIQPDAVHCHLLQANVIGLISAKLAGIKKRIYTRHHSSLHHVYHKKGIFWDKLCNSLATDIVAITSKVKEILIEWEKADERKVKVIPHGFDLAYFEAANDQEIKTLKEKYNPKGNWPVIGVVARFTEWKGVHYIIPAFKQLLEKYPNAKLLLFNANGDFKSEITKHLKSLPSDNYTTITFEQNISQAYHLFDVYVHTPIDDHSEAFGQTYIEALAAGIPSVFTLSGIAHEFIKGGENALVIPYKNSEAINEAITKILNEAATRKQLVENGKSSIKRFSLQKFVARLEDLYES